MTPKPAFKHLDVGHLIAAAGGDPWVVEDQLHAGDAGAINSLAEAFRKAGVHVQDADDEFNRAKEQFKSAYNRNNGTEHPINDAAEVQRMGAILAGHPEQLSRIGATLEQTAAALATAQRDAVAEIRELDSALHSIDGEIDTAIANGAAPFELLHLLTEADDQTAMSLGTLQGIQGAYIEQLHRAETALVATGYVPDALDQADAVADNSALARTNSALELGVTLYDIASGDKTLAQGAMGIGGSMAGAWALGGPAAELGLLIAGPPGGFVLGAPAAIVGGLAGEAGADHLYNYLTGNK